MMKSMTRKFATHQMSLLICLLLCMLAGNSLFAQAPMAFKYQAAIRNAVGEAVSEQIVSVRISILKNDPLSTPVYTETHADTTTTQGLLSLEIGRGVVQTGDFNAISWGLGEYFVKIEVDTDGTGYIPMGVSQLLAVPYALFARSAGPLVYSWEDILEMFSDRAQPSPGMMVFNTTENLMIYYNGTQWVDFNGLCFPQPTPSNAGDDQLDTPGTSTYLAANNPKYGIGVWSIISGEGGTIINTADSASLFTTIDGGIFRLQWTITNECNISEDEVVISFCPPLTTPDAGDDQLDIIGNSTILAANMPEVGNTGTWSVVSGPAGWTLSNIYQPDATFTGERGEAYTLRWTMHTACDTAFNDVNISFCPILTIALAGDDQINIIGTTTNLQGNIPRPQNTGLWTILTGEGGSFADDGLYNTEFTGLPGMTYSLKWTISSGCEVSSDTVTIAFCYTLAMANAGPDQFNLAANTAITLAANPPPAGNTGLWIIYNGTGGSFGNATLCNTTFWGTPGVVYTLIWTLTTDCQSSSDTVRIGFCPPPPVANAGNDKDHLCGPYTLQGNEPGPGNSSVWTIISGSGGTLSIPESHNAILTGQPGETYILTWRLFNPCYESFDTVSIRFEPIVTMADAGQDKLDLAGNSTVLEANLPASGDSGLWSIVDGIGGTFSNTLQHNTVFFGLPGNVYTLVWTINNACQSTSDTVLIGFCPSPPMANAGNDKDHLCGPYTLQGNDPGQGNNGEWTIISGSGGTVSNPESHNAILTGQRGETYLLTWRLFNPCYESFDTVSIRFEPEVTVADARPDQLNLPGNYTALQANPPASTDNGLWSIISGIGGSFDDNTQYNTVFSGLPGSVYTLLWTIYNACQSTSDTVFIGFCPSPPVAIAGSDQDNLCGPYTLQGNDLGTGNSGLWTIIYGEGGSLSDPESPNAILTGQPGEIYYLTWRLFNPCYESFDTVSIRFEPQVTVAMAGPDQLNLAVNCVVMEANPPLASESGVWSIFDGTGGTFSNTMLYNTLFCGLPGNTYTLIWTLSTPCENSSDTVIVSFCPILPQADAGADTLNVCSPYTLNGNNPGEGNEGIWQIISGVNGTLNNINDPNAVLYGEPGGYYTLIWSLYNPCFSSNDVVVVGFEPPASDAYAGDDQINLQGTSVALQANTPIVGNGSWSIVAGEGGSFTDFNEPNTTFTGVGGVLYTLRWKIEALCSFTTDDVNISFEIPFICGQDNLIDPRDSQVYPTIQIGNLCWMAKNLNIGNQIFGMPQQNPVIEKLCYGYDPENCTTFGGLYYWDEMMNYQLDPKLAICPEGWRIPTSNDFTQLVNYLGSDPGGKLKEEGETYWTNNVGATNESGFSAYGAGYYTSAYQNLRTYARFWSSTPSESNAYFMQLRAANTAVSTGTTPKASAYSVRCIKN